MSNPHADALEALHDAAVVWLADRAARVLVVETPGALRSRVVTLLRELEFHPHNASPLCVCEAGHTRAEPGWGTRVEELGSQHEARRKAAPADRPIPALADPPTAPGAAAFGAMLVQLLAAPVPGSDGVVCALAPVAQDDPDAWVRTLRVMIDDRRLSHLRFILVDVDCEASAVLAPAAVHRVALPADAGASLLAALAADELPGARPSTAPPPHPARPPAPPADESLSQRRAIKRAVLEAIGASHAGEGPVAARHCSRAVALSQAAGLDAEAITLQTLLGSLLLAAGTPGPAISALQTAVSLAEEAGRPAAAATAKLAIGCVRQTQGDRHQALVMHAEAAVTAQDGGQPLLAVETARATGALAHDLGMEAQAIAFWSRAVKLAESSPAVAALGGGPSAARSLAALCRKRGLRDRAAQLDARADALSAEPLRSETPPAPTLVAVQPEPAWSRAPPLTSGDEPEGTEHLPIEEIAAIHGWSADDVNRIKHATQAVLDEESTSMLTADELAALRGDAPLVAVAPAPPPRLEPEPPRPPAAAGLPAAPADALEAALAKMEALRDVNIDDEVDGESRWFSSEELARMRAEDDDDAR